MKTLKQLIRKLKENYPQNDSYPEEVSQELKKIGFKQSIQGHPSLDGATFKLSNPETPEVDYEIKIANDQGGGDDDYDDYGDFYDIPDSVTMVFYLRWKNAGNKQNITQDQTLKIFNVAADLINKIERSKIKGWIFNVETDRSGNFVNLYSDLLSKKGWRRADPITPTGGSPSAAWSKEL